MGIASFVRYVRESRLPDQRVVERHFFLLSPAERRQALTSEVAKAHQPAMKLVLSGPENVLSGFSARQRMRIYQSIMENCFITSIGQDLLPTPRKANDLIKAALDLPANLEGLRREVISHLASYLRWEDLAPDIKTDPFFADFIQDDLGQGVLSCIRDRNGNIGTLAGQEVCSHMEARFNAEDIRRQLILVNGHLLFKKRPDWSAALCLRDFFSRQGYIFVKGMYYFVAGGDHRTAIELCREKSYVHPGLFWQPSRYYDPFQLSLTSLERRYRLS